MENNAMLFEFKAYDGVVEGLPPLIMELCKGRVFVLREGEEEFQLYTQEEFSQLIDMLKKSRGGKYAIPRICEHAEEITDERSLFLAVFHACKWKNPDLSYNCVFNLSLTVDRENMVIQVISITEKKE